MNLPDQIFDGQSFPVPELVITDLHHENIGQGTTRVTCRVNGVRGKRITGESWGTMIGNPVWHIDDRIVADWFAEILESKYQSAIAEIVVIIQ